MPAIVIRGLSGETHRALKARAASNHRSTEAEVRSILDAAVTGRERVKVGTMLTQIGRNAGGDGLAIERNQAQREPVDLG